MNPVTVAQFRNDFPEFSNTQFYPDSMVNFYITFATNLMNADRWGNLYLTGMELFIAHNCTLRMLAQQTAAAGGAPGLAKGSIASETPGSVSVSYDTATTSEPYGGAYNLTDYGKEFLRLARLIGIGPMQSNGCFVDLGGFVPGLGAWPGPPTGSGYSF